MRAWGTHSPSWIIIAEPTGSHRELTEDLWGKYICILERERCVRDKVEKQRPNNSVMIRAHLKNRKAWPPEFLWVTKAAIHSEFLLHPVFRAAWPFSLFADDLTMNSHFLGQAEHSILL